MADQRRVELLLGIRTEGAVDASRSIERMGDAATTLQRELGKMARADQIARIGAEFGVLAKTTKDVGKSVAELNKQLKELGASDDEIRDAANAFAGAQGGGPSNRLGRIGSELRALPSTQIPGLSISSDQIAGLIRLGGAIGVVSDKAGEATKIGTALTPVLGATGAGLASMALAAAPFVLAAAAVIGALKALGDQAEREAKAINAIVEAQRSVAQDIAGGLTTEEAREQLKALNAERLAELEILEKNKRVYEESVNNQDVASRDITRLLSGAEQALADQIATGEANVSSYDTKIAALTQNMEDGSLAANDAAEAERKLSEERSKTALTSADNAGKALAAEQRALNATEEQNVKRLDTIKDERAVVEEQIAVLEESGVTSEEVTAKIASLKDQLGLLGKESEFITSTALAASKAADAEKKAKKDAEDAAKKAQQAQEQYTKAVDSAGTTYRQSLQDIGTRFRETLSDNELKFNRDLTDIATKYRRDEYDLELKAYRSERDAALDQANELEDIREEARKNELEALQDGDFKALFLARQSAVEEEQQQQKEIDLSKQKREQDARDAREDLLRNGQRQRQDRLTGYDRQLTDAQTAQGRELAQARLTQQRALQAASEGLKAELGLKQQFYTASVRMAQQALNQLQTGGIGVNGQAGQGGFNGQVGGLLTVQQMGSLFK